LPFSLNYIFNVFALPPFLTALAIFVLGVVIFIRERDSVGNVLYFLFALTIFIWLLSFSFMYMSAEAGLAAIWAKIGYIGVAFIPAVLFHLTAVMYRKDRLYRVPIWAGWILSAFFAVAGTGTDAVVSGVRLYWWGFSPKAGTMELPFLAFFLSFMAGSFVQYVMAYRKSMPGTADHKRSKVYILAFSIGIIGVVDFLPKYGIAVYPFGYAAIFAYMFIAGPGIWRYRLVEITPEFAARQIIDTMADALFVVDMEKHVRLVNRTACDMLGISERDIVGRPISDLIDSKQLSTHLESFMQSGDTKHTEVTCRNDRFGIRTLNISSTAITDRSGRPVSIVCLARDVTEAKEMEEELIRTRKLESLGVLAGGIAHDFNNLLTGILGNISIAKMYAPSSDKVTERLEMAEKASLRAKDLTNQLLTFSKGGDPVKKCVSLRDVLMEAAGFSLRGSNVKPEYRIPHDLWPVEIDEGQISQVINNLVINADQAMPGGGSLVIGCENVMITPGSSVPLKEGNYVKTYIRDQGTGIPGEHLKSIFDPYFTTKQKGSGLGLATAFSIINRHGGHIGVSSEMGKGTVFTFYLRAAEKGSIGEQSPEATTYKGQGRILFMDDDEIVRDIAGEMLTSIGFEVECAVDSDEAVDLFRSAFESGDPFDVVLMDLTVPGGKGGKDAIQRLLLIDPEVKGIVSSGYSNDPVMSDCTRYGFKGVITKPYKFHELSRVLYEVLGRDM